MAVPYKDIAEKYNLPHGTVLLLADRYRYFSEHRPPCVLHNNRVWWYMAFLEARKAMSLHEYDALMADIREANAKHRPDLQSTAQTKGK